MKIRKVLLGFFFAFLVAVCAFGIFEDQRTISENEHLLIRSAHAESRSVQANQRGPRVIAWQMLDDDGTNNASISIGDGEVNIADTATGTYKVTFNWRPFYRAPIVQCSDASTDSKLNLCATGSVDKNGVNILCYTAAASTTLSNFDIMNCRAEGWDAGEGAL